MLRSAYHLDLTATAAWAGFMGATSANIRLDAAEKR